MTSTFFEDFQRKEKTFVSFCVSSLIVIFSSVSFYKASDRNKRASAHALGTFIQVALPLNLLFLHLVTAEWESKIRSRALAFVLINFETEPN